jgi:hypothetical protein
MLLPSFSANQEVMKLAVTCDGSVQNAALKKTGPLFNLTKSFTGAMFTNAAGNGTTDTPGNFQILIRKNDNSGHTVSEYMQLYYDPDKFKFLIFQQSISGGLVESRTFNFPVISGTAITSLPFTPPSELRVKKVNQNDFVVKIIQFDSSSASTATNFNKFRDIVVRTYKIKDLLTTDFDPDTLSPTIYFKFPRNILDLFLTSNPLRMVDSINIANQIGPMFVSDTEVIFYGLTSGRQFRAVFEYNNNRAAVEDLEVTMMAYRGTQDFVIKNVFIIDELKYTTIPYDASVFYVIQIENFTRANNDISGILTEAEPINFLTGAPLTITNLTSSFVLSYPDSYTNEELQLSRHTTTDFFIETIKWSRKLITETGFDYYFNIPLNAASTKISTSLIVYNKTFINGPVNYSLSTKFSSSLIIPDGWYSGIDGVNYLIDSLKTLTGINTITFNPFTSKISIDNKTTEDAILFFTAPESSFQESSASIYGSPTNTFKVPKNSLTIMPLEMDLYFDGRFSQIKVNLLNFSNFGFINESLTLIKMIAKDKKGTLTQNQVVNFIKMLPPNIVLSNLSFQIVDNRNLLANFNEAIDLEFLIRCVND